MKIPLGSLALLFGLGAGLGLTQPAAAATSTQRDALLQLFDDTGGRDWDHRNGWITQEPLECRWFGVTCDANNNVIGLDLRDNNLSRSLPPLTRLTSLESFNVSNNHLTGSIPVLVDMKSLRSLDVSTNQMTGPIPSLSGLTNLQDFIVANNQFSGAIPALSDLTSLLTFNVSANQLTGSIPTTTPATLKTLNVSNNRLTGALFNLHQTSALEDVDLGGNLLTGPVPNLAGLTSLRTFKVDRNGLTGLLPVAPQSLIDGGSNLCPNPLVPAANPPSAIDKAWNAATGVSPSWSKDCTTRPVLVNVTVDLDSAGIGVPVTVGITVAANDGNGTPSGNVSIVDDLDPSATCVATLNPDAGNNGSGACTLTFVSIGAHTLTASYPGDGTFAPGSNFVIVTNPLLSDVEYGSLLSLFNTTDGSHWTHRDNWVNLGDPCAASARWFGVICNAERTHVVGIDLHDNNLSGTFKAVEKLTSLQKLDVRNNLLIGPLPNLSAMTNLQFVRADHNGLTGVLHAPPASLTNGSSSLCPNALTPASDPPSDIDEAWNAATGIIPWSTDCTRRAVQISVGANPNPAHIGTVVTIGITVAAATGGGTPSGNVTVSDDLAPTNTCAATLSAGSASCTLTFASNGRHLLTTAYAGDDNFALNSTVTQQFIEALPDSERAVLNALFLQTGGSNWIHQTGWPNGTSCTRFGVTCNADSTHVVGIDLKDANLLGSLPPLSDLTNLQIFDVSQNQLRGTVPLLGGLTNLVTFNVAFNQLTGSIPDLSGLASLRALDVRGNRLTGSIPALTDQANLSFFLVSGNGLTGLLPAPPSQNLTASICPNPLTPAAQPPSEKDLAWNAITGLTPWSTNCTFSSAQVNISVNPNPVAVGDAVVVKIKVAPAAGGTGTPSGIVIVADSQDADANCTAPLNNGSGLCALIFATPGAHTLTAGYSGSSTLSPGSGGTDVTVIAGVTPHTIGGNVSGLTGSGLVLSLNAGAQTMPIAANGSFVFPDALADGSNYAVTVLTQPTTPAQTCTVAKGSGTLSGADVNTIAVNCSAVVSTHTIGGSVSGLTGSGLVLSLNAGTQILPIGANGGFVFPNALADGSNYAVTVLTQPTAPAQTCTVANGSGALSGADVSTIAVSCSAVAQGNVAPTPFLSGWLLDLLGAVLAGIALIHLRRRIAP